MQVELRPAVSADAAEIAEIFLAAFTATMDFVPKLHTDDETRAWIRDVMLPGHDVVVAEVEGRLAGFAALEEALLGHLYVHPERQSRGVGAALLSRTKELRPGGFRLWVFQRNTGARRFYERHGLRLVELTDGAGNEEREPDALYEWLPGR